MSDVPPPIIEYRPQHLPPRTLTLEESDSEARLIFPVPPKWLPIANIGWMVGLGLLQLAVSISAVLMFIRPPIPIVFPRHYVFITLLEFWTPVVICWAWAAEEWWRFKKWGQVPRTLTVDSEGLVLSRLLWWRIRHRTWPASEITAVELRPVRFNLNWNRTVADLCFRRHNKRSLRFRLSSPDAKLPAQIAEKFAVAIGLELQSPRLAATRL